MLDTTFMILGIIFVIFILFVILGFKTGVIKVEGNWQELVQAAKDGVREGKEEVARRRRK